MKKLLCAFISVMMLLSFVGCSVGEQEKRELQSKFNEGYEHVHHDETEADAYFSEKNFSEKSEN